MNKDIYIVGIGNNTGVTIELAELAGYNIRGLLHFNSELIGEYKWGYPVINDLNSFLNVCNENINFALSMGDNQIRKQNFEKIKANGGKFPVLIHPTSSISRFSNFEEGVQIHANATIQANVIIGKNTIISFGVGVSHTSTIKDHCYLACHSLIGAYTTIENGVLIGMGSTTISGKVKTIGSNTVIGAGSLVNNSIDKNKIVYGRPAK